MVNAKTYSDRICKLIEKHSGCIALLSWFFMIFVVRAAVVVVGATVVVVGEALVVVGIAVLVV